MIQKWLASTTLLVAVGVWGLCGCKEVEVYTPPPPEVTVSKPYQTTVVDYADFTGTTREKDSVEIRARVQGFLNSIHFADGADVEKDQLLFVIEPEPFEASVTEAKARVESAKAQMKLAQSNLDRSAKLMPSGAVTLEEFNTRTAQRDSAKAAVLAAEASLQNAEIDLSYTQIHTPFAGKAGRHLVDVGNLVGSGQNTLLTTVRSLKPIDVYFDIGEIDLLNYLEWRKENEDKGIRRPVKVVYLALADQDEFTFKGTIDFTDNTVDPSTGTMQVRAVFPNEDEMIPPGAFARIRVPDTPNEDATLVWERAIGSDLGGKYVLLIGKNDVVERKYVKVGQQYGQMRVVEGISPTDRYISNGMQRARPGLPVKWTLDKTVPKLPASAIEVPSVEGESLLPPTPVAPAEKPAEKPDEKPAEEPSYTPPTLPAVPAKPAEPLPLAPEPKPESAPAKPGDTVPPAPAIPPRIDTPRSPAPVSTAQ